MTQPTEPTQPEPSARVMALEAEIRKQQKWRRLKVIQAAFAPRPPSRPAQRKRGDHAR